MAEMLERRMLGKPSTAHFDRMFITTVRTVQYLLLYVPVYGCHIRNAANKDLVYVRIYVDPTNHHHHQRKQIDVRLSTSYCTVLFIFLHTYCTSSTEYTYRTVCTECTELVPYIQYVKTT